MAFEDHQPDTPFGCVVQWGHQWAERGQFADYRTHICNHPGYADHDDHVCKCGAQAVYKADLGTPVVPELIDGDVSP